MIVADLISIHALLAESDWLPFVMTITALDFYPRSPCGERPAAPGITACHINFYPRSPCGERHLQAAHYWCNAQFLSTLSLRRATSALVAEPPALLISIHALLAESDQGS